MMQYETTLNESHQPYPLNNNGLRINMKKR